MTESGSGGARTVRTAGTVRGARIALACGAVVLLAGTACSKGDPAVTAGSDPSATASSSAPPSTTTTTTTPITKADFIARADAICKDLNDKSDALDEHPDKNSAAEITASFDRTIPLFHDGLVRLKALPIPPGDEDEIHAIWSKLDGLESLITDIRNLTAGGDLSGGKAKAENIADADKPAEDAAKAYGMVECAKL